MTRRIKPPMPSRSRATAKALRTKMTDAECALWCRLRGGRLGGLKFRRQHPIPPCVVDIYCEDAALVI
jgi:very-short-patch-repair endonuclease